MSKNKKESNENKPSPMTLSEFIEDNHKLISVLGIFSAITVFSASLDFLPGKQFLTGMLLTLSVLLWIELVGKFPSEKVTGLLTWFENILSLTVAFIVISWLANLYSFLSTYCFYSGIWIFVVRHFNHDIQI